MQTPQWSRRHRRTLTYASILLIVATIWIVGSHELSREHHVSPELEGRATASGLEERASLPLASARSMCQAHGFGIARDGMKRKVYDLVLMSTELDWLEIRLHTLAPYVDYFVIVESPTTFTGKPKSLHLKDNWHLFEAFHDKIIYKEVHDPTVSSRIWDHEDWFRNSMLTEVFPSLAGTAKEAQYGDVLVISDMDEIIRPGAMLLLRHCAIPARLTLRTHFYYYSFQWLHRGPQWPHPDVTMYRGSRTLHPNDLRMGLLGNEWAPLAALRRWWDRGTLWNAGWHCSSCFATVAEMRLKMHSFSHQGWNKAENRESKTLMDRVRNGKDLFGRPGELYDKVEQRHMDLPAYIRGQYEQKGRFKYLLDRDGEDAGFEDYASVAKND